LKPPSSYLIPNPKFQNQATEKSSDSDNHTVTTIVDLEPHASTLNPVYEYSEEINSQAEKAFKERRQRLWEVCELNKLIGKLTPNAWEFFISPGHGLTWCNVFKAASSTWMYYFNILGESSSDFRPTLVINGKFPAGYDAKYLQRTLATPLELARKRFPRPTIEDLTESLENSIAFLVVREPFERLLSAYRNKMEDGKNTYYKLLGDQIIKKFRTTPVMKGVRRKNSDLKKN
jgi:chondroitin 4-sulfotransferase 11